MITTIITIVAVILFMFFMCIMSLGVIEDKPVLVFGGIILALLLYVGIAAYPQSDMLTEPVVTKTVETESTTTETDMSYAWNP